MAIVKLPLAKVMAAFAFGRTAINEEQVHNFAWSEFLAHQRNVLLVGGTETGKARIHVAFPAVMISPTAAHLPDTPAD